MPTPVVIHARLGAQVGEWKITYPVTTPTGEKKALAQTKESERIIMDFDEKLSEWFSGGRSGRTIYVEAVRIGYGLCIQRLLRNREW